MPQIIKTFLFCLAVITAASLVGCDTSADRELRRAERALDAASAVSADRYATEDYQAAEQLLIEADDMSKDNRIQEARALAIKAKLRAEDAERKAKEHLLILEQEEDRLMH